MSFYSSNQQKLKVYTADRRVEDDNGNKQQAKVYADIAMRNGDIEMADRFAKMGMNIIGKIGRTEVPIVNEKGGIAKATVFDHIKSMIESGSLSNWWEAVKKIPPRKLSAKARIVQDDIKHNAMLKEFINEHLQQIMKNTYSGVIPTAELEKIKRFQQRTNQGISSISEPNMYDNSVSKISVINPIIDELLQLLTGGDIKVAQELDDMVSTTGTVGQTEDKKKYDASWFNKATVDEISPIWAEYAASNSYNISGTPNVDEMKKKLRPLLTKDNRYIKQSQGRKTK